MKKPKRHIAFKSITMIVLLLVVFSFIVGVIGYIEFTKALLTQYAEGGFRTAWMAARLVDADRIEEYMTQGNQSDSYRETWDRLDEACNSSGSTFIYVIRPDSSYGHITFVFSTVNREGTFTPFEFGYVRETTNDDYKTKYRALYENEASQALVVRDEGYIASEPHITVIVPLKNSESRVVGLLCVQRQMDVLFEVRQSFLWKLLYVLISLSVVVIIGVGLYLHYTLLKPVKKIADEAGRFADENVIAQQKLTDSIRNRDEIGLLAASIDQMEQQIHDYVENLTRITAEREHIRTELSLASRIQQDILPNIFPPFPDRSEIDIFAEMDPAREVGGDFYDFYLIDEDHLYITIADVSGKGVPAALFMMAVKNMLANQAMTTHSPAEILTMVNRSICLHNKEEMFVTIWLGILELSTGRLTAANAGHEYPFLRTPGGRFELYKDKHGFVVGGMEGVRYTEYELMLEPGTSLFVYTDGVPEATDADRQLFGTERITAALNLDPDADPEHILQNIRKAVDEFVQEEEQFDDLTMLCLKYKGAAHGAPEPGEQDKR